MLTHIILASSNLFGILALKNKNTDDKLMICMVMIASTMMHITESKHMLIPPYFYEYSTLFLNIDRIIAISCFIYFGSQWINKNKDGEFENIIMDITIMI